MAFLASCAIASQHMRPDAGIRHRCSYAITHGPSYRSINFQISAVRSDFALKARLLGTEFLDAETGRQKSSRKRANACRDQSPGSKWPEIPAEAPYLASTGEWVVCGDWMVEALGHKLATHHPVIEPVSAAEPGTEICDAETGTQKLVYRSAEINQPPIPAQ
jgi:hypothetical protein